jgi:hypothetical protein
MSATPGATNAVQLSADARGEPIGVAEYHAGITEHCADAIGMLARHRAVLPLSTVADTERHIGRQRDAIRSLEADCVGHVGAWWEHGLDSSDPSRVWTAVLLLGSFGGDAAHEALRAALELLPEDDDERWMPAAEALALVAPQDATALVDALLASTRPAAEAVGLDLLSRRVPVPVDVLGGHLRGEAPAVVAAATRAAVRTHTVKALSPDLIACLRSPSGVVAWEAARALTLAGVPEPYLEVRARGPLASALGTRGIEILVMAGEDTDLGAVETLLAATPMTAPLLSAVARFGNATVWSFLLHYLMDPELADAAVQALRTLFGDLVPESREASYEAWKEAIAEADFNPALRYCRGKPWHPSTVLAECVAGRLCRAEVERRTDELAARTGAEPAVDLGLWEPDTRRGLAAFSKDAGARGTRWRPGAWR